MSQHHPRLHRHLIRRLLTEIIRHPATSNPEAIPHLVSAVAAFNALPADDTQITKPDLAPLFDAVKELDFLVYYDYENGTDAPLRDALSKLTHECAGFLKAKRLYDYNIRAEREAFALGSRVRRAA